MRVVLTSSGGTSTTVVFTGQTVSRRGGPQAATGATVTIAAAPGEDVLPVTGPAAATALAIGLLAVAAGTALILMSRRCRSR